MGVAITGSLASGSSIEGADLDLLIVTKADYVWRVRALAVYLEHNARVKTRICPNMVLDRRNLKLRPSVYAARELAMMRPVKGREIFEEMISQNPWFLGHLPNANLSLQSNSLRLLASFRYGGVLCACRWLEFLPKMGGQAQNIRMQKGVFSLESVYDKLRCIGHENEHRSRIEARIVEIAMEVSPHERGLR